MHLRTKTILSSVRKKTGKNKIVHIDTTGRSERFNIVQKL